MEKLIKFFKKLFCLTPEEVVLPEPTEVKETDKCVPQREIPTPVVEEVRTKESVVTEQVKEPVKPKRKRGRPRKKSNKQ